MNAAPAEGLPHLVPLCPGHWRDVAEGAEWFAEERPGDLSTRGVQVVIGPDLVKRSLVVADDGDVTWRRGGFSARLDPGRNFGVLRMEGRVYGSDERARFDLALTPAAVQQLRSVLRLYPEAGANPST